MTDQAVLRAEAAKQRAAAAGSEPMQVPRGRPERQPVRIRSELRATLVDRDGQSWHLVEGYASVFERGYEMWDMFGPYNEVVSSTAADETLSASPYVVFRFNHGGMPMASTDNRRLELSADDSGLYDKAWLNPKRASVKELVQAIEDEDIREQSFMFRITSGRWSPDYTEYRIDAFDLDRGDVGPVTYGANPYTSVAARSGEFLDDIPNLPLLAAREAYERLGARLDVAASLRAAPPEPEEPKGPSVALLQAQLLVERAREDF
jgi:HK97 family phage prohead protease